METAKVNPTITWRWDRKVIQMASYGKVFYTEVVCIIVTINFSFAVIIMGDSIRPADLLQDSDSLENCIIESDPHLKIGPQSLMRIIEADKFDVELDSIRVSMRLLQPTQEAGQKYGTDSG